MVSVIKCIVLRDNGVNKEDNKNVTKKCHFTVNTTVKWQKSDYM